MCSVTISYKVQAIHHSITIISIIILFIIVGGCEREVVRERTSEGDVVFLTGSLLTESDSLALPLTIRYVKGFLLVGDTQSVHPLHVINAYTGEYVGGFSRNGEGPGEMLRPGSVITYPSSDTFYVHDIRLRRLTRGVIPANGVLRIDQGTSVTIRADGLLNNMIALPQEGFAGTGIHNGHQTLLHVRTDGSEGESFGNDLGGPEAVNLQFRHQGYQNSIRVKPDLSRVAVAYRYASRLDIYDHDSGSTRIVRWKDMFGPSFNTDLGRASQFSESDRRYGYVDVATSRDYIFALYSGYADGEVPDAAFGRFVHVYSWEGELISVYSLDRPAVAIEISPDGDTIFTIVHYPSVMITTTSLHRET